MKALIIVATAAEAERLHDLPAKVVVSGVGPTAAALAAWRVIAGQPQSQLSTTQPFDLVVSAGIGGAYPGSGLEPGDLAVSSAIIQADLGAQDGEEFLEMRALNLSLLPTREHFGDFAVWEGAAGLAQQLEASDLRVRFGPMLTLNTVTGTQARAEELARRFPGALTEGMEGAGVAHAALLSGLPVLEVRGVSNPVGPRDRQAWRIGEALAATRRGLEALLT